MSAVRDRHSEPETAVTTLRLPVDLKVALRRALDEEDGRPSMARVIEGLIRKDESKLLAELDGVAT